MYPIILTVRGRRALVVGGGPVAERKVRGLLDADADAAPGRQHATCNGWRNRQDTRSVRSARIRLQEREA